MFTRRAQELLTINKDGRTSVDDIEEGIIMSTPTNNGTPVPEPTPATVSEISSGLVPPMPDANHSVRLMRPATPAKPSILLLVLPIVLMVLAAFGIGGTLLYAHNQAVAQAPGSGAGRYPGGMRPSDFPTGNFTPGQRPSGFPSGNYTPGERPSGFPTGNYTPGQRPGGGQGGPNYPGGYGRQGASMRLNGWQIGVVAACGVVFVSGAALLTLTLVKRRKSVTTATAAPQGFHNPDTLS